MLLNNIFTCHICSEEAFSGALTLAVLETDDARVHVLNPMLFERALASQLQSLARMPFPPTGRCIISTSVLAK